MKYYKIKHGNDMDCVKYELTSAMLVDDYVYMALINAGNITDDFVEITKEEFDSINDSITKSSTPEALSDTESAIYDTQANVEYLVCLSELGL